MGEKLVFLINNPFFQKEQHLIRIYEKFVKKFEKNLNPLQFAHFYVAASAQNPDVESRLKFLDAQKGIEDTQAALLIKLEIVRCKNQSGDDLKSIDECKDLLEERKKDIDSFMGIMDSSIHSKYYRAALEFYQKRGPATDFFKNSILYLTYTPLESIPPAEQIVFAAEVGKAALIGHNIYNFGELLQHPIVKVLEKTNYQWLSDMLFAFNAGDLKKFRSIFSEISSSQELLRSQQVFLNDKIRIMRFMEMVFRRPADKRTITFKEVADECELKIDEVELMLMKSFSLKVVKGVVDQVEQTVRVKWVQPRVLDVNQISTMKDRFSQWTKQVDVITKRVEDHAFELV